MTTVDTSNFTSDSPIYSRVFKFEENFSPERSRQWLGENFTNVYFFCGIYVFLIFSIQYWMRNKPRYELRLALILWNGSLSLFSTFGALRTLPEFYYMLTKYGLYHSVCYPIILEPTKVTEFWAWVYSLSKIVELGDTMFVVLRKQPLNFIHWYHHCTVLIYTFVSYPQDPTYERWFKTMNYTIHSYMYLYYMLRALRFTVPRFIMMSITASQIVQMIIGCMIVSIGFYYRQNEQPCQISYSNMFLAQIMYFSYLILFSRMFYKMYLTPSKKTYSVDTNASKIKMK